MSSIDKITDTTLMGLNIGVLAGVSGGVMKTSTNCLVVQLKREEERKRRKELKDIYKKEIIKHKKPIKEKQLADEVTRVKAKAKRKVQLKYGRSTKQKVASVASSTRKTGSRVKKRSKKLAKAYKKSPTRKAGLDWAENVLKGFD